MARKGNNPGKSDGGEKDTDTKRRYQSPQTPPQAPRSRTQQSREQGSQGMEQDEDEAQMGEGGQDTQAQQGQQQGRQGQMGQQSRQGQQQGRGGLDQQEKGRQGEHAGYGQQEWDGEQAEDSESFSSQGQGDGGSYAQRGSDFDLQRASRDELNAIARELNIEDFESMNREELVTEIRERS